LLPGVDDGCKTVEESIECARMLISAGYTHCFCTPHIWVGREDETRETLPRWTESLQSSLDMAGVKLKLLPGSELNLHPTVKETPPERIVSFGLAGRYILVDMWADKLPAWFESTVKWLQGMKLTVILAHPERMRAVQDEPELAETFAKLGVLLQGNLQCFADRPDSDTRIVAEHFIREDRYFLLGSDTHNPQGLKTRLVGLRNAIALVGDRVVDRLTRENPAKLLASASKT
jgi:protein-tyrosine phosphatase